MQPERVPHCEYAIHLDARDTYFSARTLFYYGCRMRAYIFSLYCIMYQRASKITPKAFIAIWPTQTSTLYDVNKFGN